MKNQQRNPDTKWMGAGMFAAVLASLCCITPVFALIAGIGGIGSLFSWIEPFRPYLIGITTLLLGFAWYQKLKPGTEADCECDDNRSFWYSTGFLGIVTVAVAAMLAFPYYADAFFPDRNLNVVSLQEDRVDTISLDIEGMTCSGCEASVEYAVGNLDGVIEADASYETGIANIKFDQNKIQQKDIETAINQTGFSVAGSREEESLSTNPDTFYDSGDFCPLHGEGNCSGTCEARSSCTIERLDNTVAREVDQDIDVEVIKLNENYDDLKKAFNEDIGYPRMVTVLSSVCRWCIDGVKKIRETLLSQPDTENFRLYVIWMDMLKDDNYASAEKAAKLLNDPRVTHYYTSGKQLGRIIAEQITGEDGVAWDIYMYYNSDTEWKDDFPAPSEYIHQLNPAYYSWVEGDKYYSGPALKQQLEKLTNKYKNEIQ